MKTQMQMLENAELQTVSGGSVSNDTAYAAALGVSVLVIGALVTIATAGVAAPAVVTVALGVLGTGANVAAGVAASA